MIIYPYIALRGGRCVNLIHGRIDELDQFDVTVGQVKGEHVKDLNDQLPKIDGSLFHFHLRLLQLRVIEHGVDQVEKRLSAGPKDSGQFAVSFSTNRRTAIPEANKRGSPPWATGHVGRPPGCPLQS